ncbi:MAG: AbrB/MazE/SpoVT family DNA-binding domain-containing protein [Candidatus Tectomicrobia bacterium]|nr:AbrB/MazE/SpoVT family DNA-binding domain-containing protein [Candidatus Tectomicrobia bacterium]
MALLKLRHKAQVTIPADLRRQFNLEEGDYLEAEAVENGILLKPVSVVGRDETWQERRAAMGTVQDMAPERGQSAQEKEEQIARWIKEARLDHDTRRS